MFVALLRKRIRQGTLRLTMPDGREYTFGEGLPAAHWIINSPHAPWRILRHPELNLGKSYMDGEWQAGEGNLAGVLGVLMCNFPSSSPTGLARLVRLPFTLLLNWNRMAASGRNAAHHYDIDEWLYRRFLDDGMHYSCAYFLRPEMALEDAQAAKCRHIACKLLLKPGQRVLDIGSGWGSLALHLAEYHDVEVTGITLSRRQLDVARARARDRGLAGRVHFELADYREHRGTYDRIVSVGMFEHVGRPHFRRFFAQLAALLHRDGVALLHTIGHFRTLSSSNAWMRRYIFPGGNIPALHELSLTAAHVIAVYHRSGGLAPTLRRHFGVLVGTSAPASTGGGGEVWGAVLSHVGILSRKLRGRFSLARPCGVPDAARASHRCRAADPRLSLT